MIEIRSTSLGLQVNSSSMNHRLLPLCLVSLAIISCGRNSDREDPQAAPTKSSTSAFTDIDAKPDATSPFIEQDDVESESEQDSIPDLKVTESPDTPAEDVPEEYLDAGERALAARLAAIREEAIGQAFVQLRLSNGQSHEGVTIQEITDQGIRIQTNDGVETWIDANDLPADMRRQLGYDADENQRMLREEVAIAQVVANGAALGSREGDEATAPDLPQDERRRNEVGFFEISPIESRSGRHQMAFNSTVFTDATITIFGAVNYPPDYVVSYDLRSNQRFVNNVMVGSQYRAVLMSQDGEVLDEVSHLTHPAGEGRFELQE